MKKRPPFLSERMRIDKGLTEIQEFGRKFKDIPLHRWVRDLRKRMHMSQKLLAARAKITQPQLSQIESEKAKVTLETLQRVFTALFCDALILPYPHDDLDLILKNQARLAAKKKLSSLSGSMALEEQTPTKEYLERKIAEVADEQIRSGSTEIWDS